MVRCKVLFAVQQVAGYTIEGLRELDKIADVVILHIPFEGFVSEDDPLWKRFRWLDQRVYNTAESVVKALGDWVPDVYLAGGWAYRPYLALARYYHRHTGCRTVLRIDTPWRGGLRQWVSVALSRFRLTPFFDYGWGAGDVQCRYLRYLGLRNSCTGVYAADVAKFAPLADVRQTPPPHVFLYIGRYIPVKNMRRMERAFLAALEEMPESDWRMLCIGDGELWAERKRHKRITHLGYKAPWEIQQYVTGCGCFVLPSVYEPWGVVVQEAAAMGLPLLCSSQVHSASAYLKEGENGYTFDPLDEQSIKEAFLRMMKTPDDRLYAMGSFSNRLGSSYTPTDWARQVVEFAESPRK